MTAAPTMTPNSVFPWKSEQQLPPQQPPQQQLQQREQQPRQDQRAAHFSLQTILGLSV